MRIKVTLIVVVALIFVASFSLTAVQARNAQQVAPCTDEKYANSIAEPIGAYAETFKNLPKAETADEFAVIIAAGIQSRQKVGDLSVDPANPCFIAQVMAYNFLNDEIDLATYQLFVKSQLKDAEAYSKGLEDAKARIQKDGEILKALFGAAAPATEAAK